MKKVLIELVIGLTFVGCSKPERTCHAEFELLSNPEGCHFVSFYFYQGGCTHNNNLTTPIPVGTTCVSPSYLLEKGTNANAIVGADATVLPITLQYEIKFYVDGNLEETRTESYTGSSINFIVP